MSYAPVLEFYRARFAGVWRLLLAATGVLEVILSWWVARRLPDAPWHGFLLSVAVLALLSFAIIAVRSGQDFAAEALVFGVYGTVLFASVWLPVLAIVQFVLRQLRRRGGV